MALFETKNANSVKPEIAECDRQLAALAQRKGEIIRQIGQMFVENNNSQTAAGTIYEAPIKEIERIAEDAIVVEKRKLAVQGLRKCEKCGNILVLDSAFCNKCGDKLEPLFANAAPVQPQMQPQNVCPKCGATHSAGAAFCTTCGNKL